MAGNREGMKIVLQVGAELRIRNNGILRLVEPVADHKHVKVHRAND